VAARSDVVILVLTGSPQVEAVLTGEGGVLAGLQAGQRGDRLLHRHPVVDRAHGARRWPRPLAAASWTRR
jgi:hypothetical protein